MRRDRLGSQHCHAVNVRTFALGESGVVASNEFLPDLLGPTSFRN